MTTPVQQWWVVQAVMGARGGQPPFVAVESPTRPPDTSQGHTVAGPFATKAEADAWIAQRTAGPPLPSIPNPLSFLGWLQDIGHWTGILVASLTDIHMWISLGWLGLGLILLVIGFMMWFRTTDTYAELKEAATTAGAAAAAA